MRKSNKLKNRLSLQDKVSELMENLDRLLENNLKMLINQFRKPTIQESTNFRMV